MAPGRLQKRARLQTDDDDSEGSDRGKRTRRSYSQESEEASDAESIRSSAESGDSAEQAEHRSYDEQDDMDEDEAYEDYQTQRIRQELTKKNVTQNVPAECGIIQEISCTNFMCHTQLTVTLGPLINFIIGHNGSGKSAVLTALSLCLGGKASATNRGQNLKSFIKEGTDHCVVRVKIKNEGANAHKPDRYGRSIYVERHFSRSGTSGFRLKDENKKLVSQKKADLEDIIEDFALQLDNPMNVLTQDQARQFLNDSTPALKYKFFLKGTQLETLDADYKIIEESLDDMISKKATIQADAEVLQKRAQAALKKAQRADALHLSEAKEREHVNQAAWALVEQAEEQLRVHDEELEGITSKIREMEEEVDAQSQAYEQANHAFSKANQKLQDVQAAVEPKKQAAQDINHEWQENKTELLTLTRQARDSGSKVQTKTKLIEKYEAEIQRQLQLQAEADDGQHAHKVAELQKFDDECKQAEANLAEHDAAQHDLKKEMKAAETVLGRAQGTAQDKINSVQNAALRLRELEGGQSDWTRAYKNPGNLQKLLRAIDDERRFSERPIGPIGRHVTLLDQKWSSVLEKSFGASLDGFVVFSKEDQHLLSNMMRRLNWQSPVFLGKRQSLDFSSGEPDPQLTTWLRVLKVEDEWVRNQLVINHGIEQIVLEPNRRKAQELMDRGGLLVRNAKACYTLNDRDPTKGHIYMVNRQTGASNFSPIDAWRGYPRMRADKEAQIGEARNNLNRQQRELDEARTDLQRLDSQFKTCRKKLDDHNRQRRRLQIQLQEAESRKEALAFELNAARPESGKMEQLEESLKDAKGEKRFDENQLIDIQSEREKKDEISRTLKAQLEAAQLEVSQLNEELGRLEAESENFSRRRERALLRKNTAIEALEATHQEKEAWELHRGSLLADVQSRTEMALQASPRVEVPAGENYDSLFRRIKRLQQERERAQQELGGSREELTRAAAEARVAFEEKRKELEMHNTTMQTLNKSLANRRIRWENFRKQIALTSRVTFTEMLADRAFKGKLLVDHTNRRLEIVVQPDRNVKDGDMRNTKTLSGGEKSFSLICLLLSLWNAMGSPIRCLDEFDVFMDAANRDASMKMMIQQARRAIGRQYILITPQAMNSVEGMDDVKIIKLQDPERGQTALNVGR